MKRLCRAVLFDLDGTLFDTSEGLFSTFDYVIERLGFKPMPLEKKMTFIGPPIRTSLKKEYGLSNEEADRAADIFKRRYAEKDMYKASLYEGLIELFDFLRQNNIKIGLATYKRTDIAASMLEHFNIAQYFDAMNGSDYENKLTKLDIVKQAAAALGMECDRNVILIGDTQIDAAAASLAGVGFIGVSYGFGFKPGEKDAGEWPCMAMCNTPAELLKEFF